MLYCNSVFLYRYIYIVFTKNLPQEKDLLYRRFPSYDADKIRVCNIFFSILQYRVFKIPEIKYNVR